MKLFPILDRHHLITHANQYNILPFKTENVKQRPKEFTSCCPYTRGSHNCRLEKREI